MSSNCVVIVFFLWTNICRSITSNGKLLLSSMTISLKNFFVRLLFPLSLFCKHYFRLKSCKDIIRCFVLRRSCNFKSDWWHPDIIRKRSIHFRSFYWSIKTVPYCLIIVSYSTYNNSMESKVNAWTGLKVIWNETVCITVCITW